MAGRWYKVAAYHLLYWKRRGPGLWNNNCPKDSSTMNVNSAVNEHFKFKLQHVDKHCGARAGIISTPHGDIETPVFMPVGTHGAIKALQPKELVDLSIQIPVSNTYHLHLTPGSELIAKAGGSVSYTHLTLP